MDTRLLLLSVEDLAWDPYNDDCRRSARSGVIQWRKRYNRRRNVELCLLFLAVVAVPIAMKKNPEIILLAVIGSWAACVLLQSFSNHIALARVYCRGKPLSALRALYDCDMSERSPFLHLTVLQVRRLFERYKDLSVRERLALREIMAVNSDQWIKKLFVLAYVYDSFMFPPGHSRSTPISYNAEYFKGSVFALIAMRVCSKPSWDSIYPALMINDLSWRLIWIKAATIFSGVKNGSIHSLDLVNTVIQDLTRSDERRETVYEVEEEEKQYKLAIDKHRQRALALLRALQDQAMTLYADGVAMIVHDVVRATCQNVGGYSQLFRPQENVVCEIDDRIGFALCWLRYVCQINSDQNFIAVVTQVLPEQTYAVPLPFFQSGACCQLGKGACQV
jgi:hypothetical protein